VILLSEVAPVITLGRRAEPDRELTLSRDQLAEKGISIYPTGRGGLATYHGPGQWVLFVVESLERLTGDRRGVRRAVEGLLHAAMRVAKHWRSDAEIRGGAEVGIWTKRGKVGALGVQVERGVLLHGVALNVYATPESFVGLRPCGLDAPVDFLMAADLGEREFEVVADRFLASACQEFEITY